MKAKTIVESFFGAVGIVLSILIFWLLVTGRMSVDSRKEGPLFLFLSTLGPSFICIGFCGPRNFVSGITGAFIHGPFAIWNIGMAVREVVIKEDFWIQGITMIRLVNAVIVIVVFYLCIWWTEYCIITVFGEKGRKFFERHFGWKLG